MLGHRPIGSAPVAGTVPPAGPGNVYDVSVAESATPGDSPSVAAMLNVSRAESATPGESASVAAVLLVSVAEAATPGESSTRGLVVDVSVTEPLVPGGGPSVGGGSWTWVG